MGITDDSGREEPSETYDADGDESLSAAVPRAVAEATDSDPTELPPLQRAVDADALDELFGETIDGRARAGGSIVFEYGGYTVVASADGEILVEKAAESDPR